MKKLIILTGATGGIGSAILKQISNKEYDICILSRNNPSSNDNINQIKVDFANDNNGYLDEIRNWIVKHKNISEVVIILASSVITPINAIGNMYGLIRDNIYINVLSQIQIIDIVTNIAQTKNCPVRIIQFDSGAAYRPVAGWSLYCSAKAYMSIFLRTLAEERNDYKIVLFDPGVVDTGMQENIRNADVSVFKDRAIFLRYREDRKLNDPNEVAEFVVRRYLTNWSAESINEKYADG